jgi:aminopeptidase N
VDQVIAADTINPASSSRLVLPLTRWQRFEPKRRALMLGALERLAQRKNSRDLAEILANSLKDA